MRQIIKQSLWVLFLAVSLQATWAFSLGGPIGTDSDTYQTISIGYNIKGDVNAPKNWGEGYRRNVPILYYAYDASFTSFFGTNAGPASVDAAYAVLNNLTNLSSYSSSLSEFPTESRQVNYLAQSLALRDIKSFTLALMVEQMGLANPARYVWTMHDRNNYGPAACPADMEYSVIMRNFDPDAPGPNTTVYSPYVNDTLYTYTIEEFCAAPGTPPNAFTVPVLADPNGDFASPVASFDYNYSFGDYYTGLTRDDVEGLRTLMASNNIVKEDAPFQSVQLVTNALPLQLLSTVNYGALLSSLLLTDPVTLLTNFPNLQITSTATNFVSVTFTNVTLAYSNQTVLPIFTNYIQGGLTNGFYFTNQPGPTVINFDDTYFDTLTNMDLALFVDQAKTNDPITLLGLYPNLVISSYSEQAALLLVTNYVSYLTNITGSPYGQPVPVTVPASVNFALITNWFYTFGNVITNHLYTNRLVTIQTISSSHSYGSPYGSALTLQTNISHYYTNLISGDFFLIPTNWCGFDVALSSRLNVNPPYQYSYTNTIIYGGFTTNNAATGTTNLPTASTYGYILSSFYTFTNYIYAIQPGICEPVLTVTTNYSTNVVAEYQYTFGNVITNGIISSNSFVTVITTNITPVFGGAPGQLATNVTVSSYYTNVPSGGIFITPSNWCGGFNIISNYYTNTIYVTNFFVVTNNTTTSSNLAQFSETIISQYTNNTYLIQPLDCGQQATPGAESRQGVERIQYIRGNYDSDLGQFFQPITNIFVEMKMTNYALVPETFQRVVLTPDFLFEATDSNQVGIANAEVINNGVFRNLNFNDPNNILPGQAGPGLLQTPTFFLFNKVGPVLANNTDQLDGYAYLSGAFSLNGLSIFDSYYLWATFDGSTNLPIVFPETVSVASLENQVLLRLAPAALPDATNGVPYTVTLSATGGQPPYTFSVVAPALLPTGMTLNAGVISGTPTAVAGTYDFVLQLSDSGGLSVQYTYPITIH